MIRKNLGFDLQKVTRQSLSSLEEIDKYYLDVVVSRLFERIATCKNSFFYIDDFELKKYLSIMLRHHALTHKIKSHIITLDENTSSLPYDVPFDNCVLLIDVQPNTSSLYIESLAPLVKSCTTKDISIIILSCNDYDFDFLNSFIKFDAYDCLFSEHEIAQISKDIKTASNCNLYHMTSGLPTLMRAWIASDNELDMRRGADLFQNALINSLEWYMRDSLSPMQRIKRIQMLLIGEISYKSLMPIGEFDLDSVCSPFTVASGRSISCAGWEDCLSYSMFFDSHKDMLYGMEGAVIEVLEFLYASKNWRRLVRALAIIPNSDVVAHYVAKIPFEVINYGQCSLIEKAAYYERALTNAERLALAMGEATITGNTKSLLESFELYSQDTSHDKSTVQQGSAIISAYQIIQGKSLTPDLTNASDDELLQMLNLHCEIISCVNKGDLETAYERVLLFDNRNLDCFTGQLLELDLMILSLLLGDDSWFSLENRIHPIIEGLSSSGVVSVNLFAPVINDCIDCVFNNEVNSFALDRGISSAQNHGFNLLSSWLLTYSVAHNIRIKNLLKAYTQVQLLKQVTQKCDSRYIANIAYILELITCTKLEETCEIENCFIDSPASPEDVVLVMIADLITGRSISVSSDVNGSPSGIWWLVFLLEEVDTFLIQELLDYMHPTWIHDYQLYKIRIGNLTNQIREAFEMNKAEEQVLKERNTLCIKVMGGIDIRTSGKQILEDDWNRKAAKMMLLYLAVADNHTLSRADLQELLWPDKDYIAARGNLYTALSSLKKTIGHNDDLRPYIKSSEGYISLNPECVYVDSDVFCNIARKMSESSTNPDSILALYESFVDTYDGGLFVPVGDESGLFLARREYLESMYLETLMTFSELSLRMGRPRQAICCAKEILSIDDRREDAFVLFMQGLHSMGRRAEVVTAYSIFSKNLINKYGIAVSASTRDMYAEIIQDESRPDISYKAV